jgi:hypothetical protein
MKENDTESKRSVERTDRYRLQLQEKVIYMSEAPQQDEPQSRGMNAVGPSTNEPETKAISPGGTGLATAGPSKESPQQDEPRNGETSAAGPSTNAPETKVIPSGEDKEENAGPEPKRAKNHRKKKGKGASLNLLTTADPPSPVVPEIPATTEPKTAQHDAGVEGGNESKEIDEARASARDQRSGRQSTEINGSERRKLVDLFRDPSMIPGAFPGARILSFTYPKVSAETAEEYLDKVTQKLLESLIERRSGSALLYSANTLHWLWLWWPSAAKVSCLSSQDP